MTFHAHAAKQAKVHLKPFDYEPKPLGQHDVEIAITHCGICHSDVHLVDGEWGDHFPLVPGHEIIGIGGLGHLGLQFAKALGCEVTAFSRTADKQAAARRFGADHFVTGEPERGSLDLILNTAHVASDMAAYLGALRPKGVFCQLGAAPEPLSVPATLLIGGSRSVTGSEIGSPAAIRAMLDLAARHGIGARTEVMPMAKADAALDRTRRNQARYRMVLAN